MLRRLALLGVLLAGSPVLAESATPLLSIQARYQGHQFPTLAGAVHDDFVITRQRRTLGQRLTTHPGWMSQLIDVRVARGQFTTLVQELDRGASGIHGMCGVPAKPPSGPFTLGLTGEVVLNWYGPEQAWQRVVIKVGSPEPVSPCTPEVRRILTAAEKLISHAVSLARLREAPPTS